MMQQELQGIYAKQTLTENEIADIQQLAVLCSAFEGLHMRLFMMDIFKQRSGNNTYDFLYYEQGLLVGYLGIENYGTKTKEIFGMVHPEHRRKGIGSHLLQAAREEGRHSGIEQFVLTCERASLSGTAFAKAIDAKLDYSEHEMVLGTFKERFVFDERVIFRQAIGPEDLEKVASIIATDRDNNVEWAQKHIVDMMKLPNQRFYMLTFGGTDLGCDEPIGSLRLDEMEQLVGIYGFVVRPEYRGRGYGRQLLQEVIHSIHNEGSKGIMLEVDVDNTNALGLYLSCGFEIVTTYDYYIVEVM